jgi:hypothetical protein
VGVVEVFCEKVSGMGQLFSGIWSGPSDDQEEFAILVCFESRFYDRRTECYVGIFHRISG